MSQHKTKNNMKPIINTTNVKSNDEQNAKTGSQEKGVIALSRRSKAGENDASQQGVG